MRLLLFLVCFYLVACAAVPSNKNIQREIASKIESTPGNLTKHYLDINKENTDKIKSISYQKDRNADMLIVESTSFNTCKITSDLLKEKNVTYFSILNHLKDNRAGLTCKFGRGTKNFTASDFELTYEF